MTRSTAPQTADRRLSLLKAAFREVAEKGFSEVTLDDIARRAARLTTRGVLTQERGDFSLHDRVSRGTRAPVLDLHTGEEKENQLVMVGVAVQAQLLPLLQ